MALKEHNFGKGLVEYAKIASLLEQGLSDKNIMHSEGLSSQAFLQVKGMYLRKKQEKETLKIVNEFAQ